MANWMKLLKKRHICTLIGLIYSHFTEDKNSEPSAILTAGTWEQSYFNGTRKKKVGFINLEIYVFKMYMIFY